MAKDDVHTCFLRVGGFLSTQFQAAMQLIVQPYK